MDINEETIEVAKAPSSSSLGGLSSHLSEPIQKLSSLSAHTMKQPSYRRSVSESPDDTISSSSTSVRKVRSGSFAVRRLSGLFKKSKKKTPMQMHASVIVAAEGSVTPTSTMASLEEEDTDASKRTIQKETDVALVKTLEVLSHRLDTAVAELERCKEKNKSDFRVWMLKSLVVLGVGAAIVLFNLEKTQNAWLVIAVVSLALYMTNTNEDLSLAQAELNISKQTLNEALVMSRGDDVPQAVVVNRSVLGQSDNKEYSPEGSGIDFSGFRLNIFANLEHLDFDRDVLAPLALERQNHFREMESKFLATFDRSGVRESNVPDKFTILRFLQADKYDVDKAVVRLQKTIAWREATNCDGFIDNVDWNLIRRGKAIRPRIFCGFDKHKRPLMAEKLGEFFGNEEAFKGLSFQDWIRMYTFELGEVSSRFRTAIEKHNAPYQHRIAYIGDVKGIRFMQAIKAIPFLKLLVKEVESHFPEFAGSVVLINAPSIAIRLFSIVKKFLDPATVDKITLTSSDSAQELIDQFGAEVVPVEYGGKNPIQIPACPKKISAEFNQLYPYSPT